MGPHNHFEARPAARLSTRTVCVTTHVLYNAVCGRFAKAAGFRRYTGPAVASCLGKWIKHHLLGDFVSDSNDELVSSLPDVTDKLPQPRITNTAPSPIYLSTINGAATSLGCLARTLGPATTGWLFRLGRDIGYIGLPFWALGAVAGMGLAVSYSLQDHP